MNAIDDFVTPLLEPGELFEALVFDCDGTLVDTSPTHFAAYNRALATYSLEMPIEFYLPRFGLSPYDLLIEFAQQEGKPLDVNRVVPLYVTEYQSDLTRLREIRLVADLARQFSRKIPIAVASNGTRTNVERTLRTVGLFELFDSFITIEDVERGKPAPDIYLEAAKRFGKSPADCIVFEDTDEGLQAARSAGMRARDVRPFVMI